MFGESRVQHYREKQARQWKSDGNVVTELDEYKDSGVVKNYACSLRFEILEAIEKTRKRRKCSEMAVLIAEKPAPLLY